MGRVAAGVLLGAVVSGCALPASTEVTAAARGTTAAADAPHPLTTLPGVRAISPPTTALPPLPTAAQAGTLLAVTPGPTAVKVTSVDGCNRSYGTAAQCVPTFAPGGKPLTCAYLKASGLFGAPLVVVRDPLGLLGKKNVKRGRTADGKYATISGCTD